MKKNVKINVNSIYFKNYLKFLFGLIIIACSFNVYSATFKFKSIECFKEFNKIEEDECSDKVSSQMVMEPISYSINNVFNLSTEFEYINNKCNRLSRLKFWCLKENEWSLEVSFDFNTFLEAIAIQKISQVSCLPPVWLPVQQDLIRKFGQPVKINNNKIDFFSVEQTERLFAHFESAYRLNEQQRGNDSLNCPGGMRLRLEILPRSGLNAEMFNEFIKDINKQKATQNKPKF